MARELGLNRSISDPTRYPLRQTYGPPFPEPGEQDLQPEDESAETMATLDSSFGPIGISEMAKEAKKGFPFVVNDNEHNLKLGPLFDPNEVSPRSSLEAIAPLAIGIPGSKKPVLAIFDGDINLSVIRESFYNEYFTPPPNSSSLSIPTEHGILTYDERSIVRFNKDSPVYIKEPLSGNQYFNVNQADSMQTVGVAVIPFCLAHDNTKTHLIQVLVVKELFPWEKGVKDDVQAVIAARDFAPGITYANGLHPVPLLFEKPVGLYLQEGYLQICAEAAPFDTTKKLNKNIILPEKTTEFPRHGFGIGVWFSNESPYNYSNYSFWDDKTEMKEGSLGCVVALLAVAQRLVEMADCRGLMRNVKGVQIYLSDRAAVTTLEAIRDGSRKEDIKSEESWVSVVQKRFEILAELGLPVKLEFKGFAENGGAFWLADQATINGEMKPDYLHWTTIREASDRLLRDGVFDTSGITHDENTVSENVVDADVKKMKLPGFLSIRYEEPLDSLLRKIEAVEMERDPHYNNNEATPEEDIFNMANYK